MADPVPASWTKPRDAMHWAGQIEAEKVEMAQDAAAGLFAAGTHVGIVYTYDDLGNKISSTVTGVLVKDVTGLQIELDNKVGGTTLHPIGSMGNPVTDPAAARPSGIPAVVWRTETTPTNAATGDWVFLPDAGGSTAPVTGIYVQLWDETNGTGVAGWAAQANAGSVVRSTDAAKTGGGSTGAGSLQWAAVAAGESSTKALYSSVGAVSPLKQYTTKATFYNGDTVARSFKISMDFATDSTGASYISVSHSAQSPSVLPGAKVEVVYTFTTPSSTGGMRPLAVVTSGAAAATFNVSRVSISEG